MLEVISTDSENRKREMDRRAMDATEIFIKIFGDEVFGPRIQHYFRNWCLTLMEDIEDGWTLIDVPRLFVDDAFMKYKVSKIKNPVVKSFGIMNMQILEIEKNKKWYLISLLNLVLL